MNKSALPKQYLSVSQLNTYDFCGYKYFYQYFLQLPYKPSLPLVFGKAGHHALETFLADPPIDLSLHYDPSTQEEILSHLYSRFMEYWSKHKGDVPGLTAVDERNSMGMITALLSDFIDNHLHRLKPQKLEHRVQTEVAGIPMIGYIDFIGEVDVTPMVLDYKFVSREKDQKTADSDIQLTFYSLATEIDNVGFLNFVKPHPYFHPQPYTRLTVSKRTDSDYAAFAAQVEKTAERIGSRDFRPADPKHPLCSKKYCELWDVCPAGRYRNKPQPPERALKAPSQYE